MSKLEEKFVEAWKQYAPKSLPDPEQQLRFHPVRKWKADFAWPSAKLILEVQGGNHVFGAHARGPALRESYIRLNEATRLGWRTLMIDDWHLAKCRQEELIDLVVEILTNAQEILPKRKIRKSRIDSE